MIHALLQYAVDRGLVSKPGYATKTVRWVLSFDERGRRFTGLLASDRKFPYAPDLSQPELKTLGAKRGAAAAHFLVAPLGTLVGWGEDKNGERRERQRHGTLTWMLQEATKEDSSLRDLYKALGDSENLRAMREAVDKAKPAAKPTDLATVRLGDRFPVEGDGWHAWWDRFRATLKKTSERARLMASFMDGSLVTAEPTHPKLRKLSGVGLSQPHAPIITFDKDAFESYGLSQGENAAMSAETAHAYVNAIDHMLENSVIYSWRRPKPGAKPERSRDFARIGGARLAYWYVGPAEVRNSLEEFDLIGFTLGSANRDRAPPDDPEERRALVESRLRQTMDYVRSGKGARPIGDAHFCVLALSGSGGRVMVRDFIEGTVLDLAETTKRWFTDLSLVTYMGREGYPPSLEQVLTAPLSPKKPDQDYLKWVAPAGAWRQALWRAALTGGRLPQAAFSRALSAHNNTVVKGELTDSERGLLAQARSRLRLAVVKAYLARTRKGGHRMESALDQDHPSPAYHCGRLLAVYDSLQRAALGDVGAGVVQRFYGGALTNPSGVFGQLSRMALTHIAKLEGGLAHIYAERIGEIHNGIRKEGVLAPKYPSALDMEGQALFALGFWHQTAAINKERSLAAAAKKARGEAKKTYGTVEEDNSNG